MGNIFKCKIEDEGKILIVRPLLNIKDMTKHILSYKTTFSEIQHKWNYRYLCYALVNDEFKIFDFSKKIHEFFLEMDSIPSHMLMMNSDRALKITIKTKQGFLDNEYEVIHDDKYRFDNTPEKKKFILKHYSDNKHLDLSEALKQQENFVKELSLNL